MYERTVSIDLQRESKTGRNGTMYDMMDGWNEGAFIDETSKQRSTTGKTRKNDQGNNATQDEKEGWD